MNTKKKVRLSDIADKLGISTVTVSKAIADKEGVGDDLRQQIKNLAEEMGYKTKKTGILSNSGNTTGNIGILIPSRFFSSEFSFYWFIFNHLSKALLNRNYYSIMELLTNEDEKALKLPRMMQDKKIDGLIILGQIQDSYLEILKSQYENFILLDFYSNKLQLDSVSDDDFYCSYQITNYVISQGHRKIRFVGNFGATTSITDRFMGFQKAMYEHGYPCSPLDIINDRDSQGRYIDFDFPVEMPTAFVCNCDETAGNLIAQLEKKGFRVPQDISVTGFDNFVPQGHLNVGLTTATVKPEDIANVASDLILKKIRGEEYIKGRHLVGGSLIIRDSVQKI